MSIVCIFINFQIGAFSLRIIFYKLCLKRRIVIKNTLVYCEFQAQIFVNCFVQWKHIPFLSSFMHSLKFNVFIRTE